jgi:hypothetical protein
MHAMHMPLMKCQLWFGAIMSCVLIAAAHADVPAALDRASISFGGFYPVVDARLCLRTAQRWREPM